MTTHLRLYTRTSREVDFLRKEGGDDLADVEGGAGG